MNDRQQSFYEKLRSEVEAWSRSEAGAANEWVEQIRLAPDLFQSLCGLAEDSRVPGPQKARLAAAIAYFISPFDLESEATTGVAGFADDIVLAAQAIRGVLDVTSPEVVGQHWVTTLDAATTTTRILEVADRMVGSNKVAQLRAMIS